MKSRKLCLVMLALGIGVASASPSMAQTSLSAQSVPADTTAGLPRWSAVQKAPQSSPSIVLLPAGAATAHYGFFCKQELKWDKVLPTQLRFRVGSFESCDRLEGKRRD